MVKKYYVTRGGRDMCITQDYNQAMLFAKNKPERIQEFNNYHIALRLLGRMVESALEHSLKPTGDYIHLDVSVSRETGMAEFRIMQGERYIMTARNIEHCSSNIAEFLALVEAHKYCTHYDIKEKIYCDNATAIRWFKRELELILNPTAVAANPKIKDLVSKAMEYVNSQKEGYYDNVTLWDKSMWGEIPSDYKKKKENERTDKSVPERSKE